MGSGQLAVTMQILAYSSSVLQPQSPEAKAIFDLGIVSLIVFVLIWIVVSGGILYAILRFRGRGDEADPEQVRR